MKRSGTKYVCANVNYLLEAHKTAEVEKAKAGFYRSGRILRDYYTGGSCCVVKSASGLTSEGMAKQQFIVDKELMPKLDMLSKEDTVDYDDQSEDANKLSAKPSAKPSPSTFANGDEALAVQEDDEESSIKKAVKKKKAKKAKKAKKKKKAKKPESDPEPAVAESESELDVDTATLRPVPNIY